MIATAAVSALLRGACLLPEKHPDFFGGLQQPPGLFPYLISPREILGDALETGCTCAKSQQVQPNQLQTSHDRAKACSAASRDRKSVV